MSKRWSLLIVWLLFVARGAFYAAVIPLWEGLDEYAHVAFVNHLIVFRNLPGPQTPVSAEISRSLDLLPLPWALDFRPAPAMIHDKYWELTAAERAERESLLRQTPQGSQAAAGRDPLYEGKQPPLYYLLCVPVLKTVWSASLATRVLVLRLFTVLLGSLIVPLTFLVARRVFREPAAALLASIVMTAMPGLVMTSSRVGNDPLAIVLFAVLAWALLRPTPWDTPGALLIGLTVGAGFLTKAYFVAAAPAVAGAGLIAIWRASPKDRKRVVGLVTLAAVVSIGLSAWWYLRILGAEGPVWADAAPSAAQGASGLMARAREMPWWEAVRGALNTHIWLGGWSFLGVRSWIYLVFRWIFFGAFLGSFAWMLRGRSNLAAPGALYCGFWAAMMYHAFVTFVGVGIPSFTGIYLFAVAACEGVILVSAVQWLGEKWAGRAIAIMTSLFLLMEAYATHFALLPYFTGLIRHRPDRSLGTFYIPQIFQTGWREILQRLDINKADFLGPGLLALLWGVFLIANACLAIHAWKVASRSR